MYTDSHTHLYLNAFDGDRDEMIRRALDAGISRMFLPNIDDTTISGMLRLCNQYPVACFPMLGLHPTSVRKDFRQVLKTMEHHLDLRHYIAIGETGIDLYWDSTFREEQVEAFKVQIGWAKQRDLPIVIHARESFSEIFNVLEKAGTRDLNGVFHSFTGNPEQLDKALSFGFMIGLNGIVTFKNSGLEEVVRKIPPERILLETDAPFLAPVPYRGKRNESSYLVEVASRVAEIHNLTKEELAGITTRNSEQLFRLRESHGSW